MCLCETHAQFVYSSEVNNNQWNTVCKDVLVRNMHSYCWHQSLHLGAKVFIVTESLRTTLGLQDSVINEKQNQGHWEQYNPALLVMKFTLLITLFQRKFLFQRKLTMSHSILIIIFFRKVPLSKSCHSQSKRVTHIWLKIPHFTSSWYYSSLSDCEKIRQQMYPFMLDSTFCKTITLLFASTDYFLSVDLKSCRSNFILVL